MWIGAYCLTYYLSYDDTMITVHYSWTKDARVYTPLQFIEMFSSSGHSARLKPSNAASQRTEQRVIRGLQWLLTW